jgi:hypothetical protein
MIGKCAYNECPFDTDELAVEPCSFCKKNVHHACSNEVFESDLTQRFYSMICVENFQENVQENVEETTKEDEQSSEDEPELEKKKMYTFTPEVELALLKEVLNIEPYAGAHKQITNMWKQVAENLGAY